MNKIKDLQSEETKTLKTYIWADTLYSHLEYELFAVMAYSKEEAKALILEKYEKYAGEKFDETLRDTLNEVEPIILSPLEAQLINHANF